VLAAHLTIRRELLRSHRFFGSAWANHSGQSGAGFRFVRTVGILVVEQSGPERYSLAAELRQLQITRLPQKSGLHVQ